MTRDRELMRARAMFSVDYSSKRFRKVETEISAQKTWSKLLSLLDGLQVLVLLRVPWTETLAPSQ